MKKLKSPEVRGNRAKQREIRQKIAELNRERQKIRAKFERQILTEVLKTPELKLKWRAAELLQSTIRRLRRERLREDQKNKAMQYAIAAAKKLQTEGLFGKEKLTREQRRRRAQILKELNQKVVNLLTPEQKAKIKKPTRKPRKEAKEAEKGRRKGRRKQRKPEKEE